MDIYDYAMQMEQDGEAYYRDLASKCEDTGLKTILTMLANEEVMHHRILADLKAGSMQTPRSDFLPQVKNVFAQMQGTELVACNASQIDAYQKAQGLEQKSIDLYSDRAQQEQGAAKALFTDLAEEEKKHYMLLDNIIAFVSEPQQWLENAEWARWTDK